MLPTFIGLGAQRAGTTWLYSCLAEHPEVFVSRKKELYYFSKNYALGREWYEAQFAEAGTAKARGEITPDYMYREIALERIARDMPEVASVIILRNPIDRAISAYALHAEKYQGLSFRQAADQDSRLVERGFYTRHLETVYRYLPRERVKVLFYDDIGSAPGRLLDELFAFIGVSTGFRPASIGKRVNRVIYPALQKRLQRYGLDWTVDAVKRTPVGGWIRRRHSQPRREGGTATPDDIRWMSRLYAPEVASLSRLTGRDLRHWTG